MPSVARFSAAELAVDLAVVVVRVEAHLRLIGPVHLVAGRLVVGRVAPERFAFFRVREDQQIGPVALGELAPRGRDRHVVGHRPVAGEHAAAQELGRALVDGELEVAVGEAVGDALAEGAHQAVDLPDLDHALHLAPRHQPQRDRVDEAEQAVAADRQAEQIRILGAAALHQVAARVDQAERLDVADEGRRGRGRGRGCSTTGCRPW